MKPPPALDGRLAEQLEAELRRRAIALRGEGATAMPVGPIENAIYAVAGRIGEEVTTRLDKAPVKQADNFYLAAGLGRDPGRAASLPVAFKLTDAAREAISAPAGTQLLASAAEAVIFETEERIDLVPGRIEAIRGVNAEFDKVTIPAAAALSPQLPKQAPLIRRLRAAANVGDDKVQLNPASGLKPGALLAFGSGREARHHLLAKLEDDLATIEPPLELGLEENAPVTEVLCFAPFDDTTRDHQQHALYLAHATLLDTPSQVSFRIGGIEGLPEDAQWEWWGTETDDQAPAWHAMSRDAKSGDVVKSAGKPQKTKVNGRESFWIRARLPDRSTGSAKARDVTLAVVGEGCEFAQARTGDCRLTKTVEFDAIAVNGPVVVNKPFHPFSREPRLYDSFSIGSPEAFPKVGARVAMDFAFGGASLGPMAAVAVGQAVELFGVGTDGLLYRVQATANESTLLPVPRKDESALAAQAQVAALTIGRTLHVAVAGKGKIDVATMEVAGLLTPERVAWKRYDLPDMAEAQVLEIASQTRDNLPGFVVLVGERLFRCVLGGTVNEIVYSGDGADSGEGGLPVLSLAVITHTGSLIAVTASGRDGKEPALRRIGMTAAGDTTFKLGKDWKVQFEQLTAWSRADSGSAVFVADSGDRGLRLFSVGADGSGPTTLYEDKSVNPQSLCFVAPDQSHVVHPPLLVSSSSGSSAKLDWIVPEGSRYLEISDAGNSTGDISRAASVVATDNWIAAQHGDVGVLVREISDPAGVTRFNLPVIRGRVLLAEHAGLPNDVFAWAPVPGETQPDFYAFDQPQPGPPGRLAHKVEIPEAAAGDTDHLAEDYTPLVFDPAGNGACEIDEEEDGYWKVKLAVGGYLEWSDVDDQAYVRLSYGSAAAGTGTAIFRLEPKGTGAGPKDRWKIPDNFPDVSIRQDCQLLFVPSATEFDLFDAVPIGSDYYPAYAGLRAKTTLQTLAKPGYIMQDRILLGGQSYVLAPEGSVARLGSSGNQLQLVVHPPWRRIGPDLPANPALSWEYWNGRAWWALDGDEFYDGTGHFQTNGCVRFTVPADIQPTEVSGKPGHWIRARLIGGDYGEARITVVQVPESEGGGQQTKRDVSTIRAPYIVSLRIAYCALDPVPPEIVYSEDSLGFIDQTSANAAGLDFNVFVPLSQAMNPPDPEREAAEKAVPAAECDDPCAEDAPPEPDPCLAPGAYDSCDSPCVRPPGQRHPEVAGSLGFVRGMLVGFDKRFSGNTISIYVMAEPSGSPAALKADILRDGRFVSVQVMSDTSFGLTEPGLLTLSIPVPPDETDLFGDTSHWLRLWPEGDASVWSPRICGLFLNGAMTRSTETRTMERLGASDGTSGQSFRLAEAPVDPSSLVLRVRELLSQQEREGLDIHSYPQGPPGEWVLWRAVSDFSDDGEPERGFVLDAERGELRFGDGDAGRIPPLGAELLAERYARVRGASANGVAAGARPTLLASLAGVDSVLALDQAAGGSNVELAEQARRRAAAKLRHGGWILTAADLADFVPTLAPDIAQARVIETGRSTRIVVAQTGAEPRPLPATLRAIERNVAAVSGYGLRRPGGFKATAPRVLPLGVTITLALLDPDSFADAEAGTKRVVGALFDAATGGHNRRGWPIGRLPAEQDIAAALMEIGGLAFPAAIELRRADRPEGLGDQLPERLPPDVLVRLDSAALLVRRAQEQVS